MTKEKLLKFGDNYPCGPCPDDWKNCTCECGWKYKENEIVVKECDDNCEVCQYCGEASCPKCGVHLHCGGCI